MGNRPYKVEIHVDTSDESCVGVKYNHLTIVRPAHIVDGYKKITCRCDCGTIIDVVPFNWKSGRTKSCGCKTSELLSNAFSKLEHTKDLDRLRRIYGGMKCRCYNKNIRNYKNYGGRGIRICDEWLNDREAFISWALSNGYDNSLSIDRIDVNGNYEPSNCRWATGAQQRANQRPQPKGARRHLLFTIDGITKPALEWCEEYGVSPQFVRYRIKHKGMSPKDALTAAKQANGRPRKK